MGTVPQRFHYYHADANSLGGTIHRPFEKVIPAQASVSLPAAGGYASARTGAFDFEGLLSCSGAACRVSGSVDEHTGDPTTLVTAVVENLNLLDIISADRVISQISTDRPSGGQIPRVTFVGSQFVGLRIAGFPVEPLINLQLLLPTYDGPNCPWLKNETFLTTARDQFAQTVSGRYPTPDWLMRRYGWIKSDKEIAEYGHVQTSLVDGFEGTIPGKSWGHIIEIAEVGKFFFGEVSMYDNIYRLTMVRAEIGSGTAGTVSGGSTGSNGGSA